jgi:hypothetical protein
VKTRILMNSTKIGKNDFYGTLNISQSPFRWKAKQIVIVFFLNKKQR